MIFTEYLTHFLLKALSLIFSLLPRKFTLLLGRNIGLFLYLIPFRKKVARKGSWFYEQVCIGFNYRMNEISAALGKSQLEKVNSFTKKRIKPI